MMRGGGKMGHEMNMTSTTVVRINVGCSIDILTCTYTWHIAFVYVHDMFNNSIVTIVRKQIKDTCICAHDHDHDPDHHPLQGMHAFHDANFITILI